MWNFLKNAVGQIAQSQARYYENRMFIQQLMGLPDNQALQMLQSRVQSLDERGYQEFTGAIFLMIQEAQAAWQQAQSGSYNTAFDDSYEGQLYGAYAHAMEGPRSPSPAESYQMQQVQQYAQSLQNIGRYAEQFHLAASRVDSRLPAAGTNRGSGPASPPSRAKSSAEIRQQVGEDSELDNPKDLQLLRDLAQAEKDEGTISPERKVHLDAILNQVAGLVDSAESDDLDELMAASEKIRQLTQDLTPSLAKPSLPKRKMAAPSRAERTAEILGVIKTQLANENRLAVGPQEKSACEELFKSTIPIQTALNETDTDADVYNLEREALRPLALKMQELFLRNHMLVTVPNFPTRPVTIDPNGVFFSGDSDLRQMLAKICKTLKLSLQSETISENLAEQRWNQLRASAVAIFDFRKYARKATYSAAPKRAAAVAAIAYELGIALAIGKPVVVVIKYGQEVPFDIDVIATEFKDVPGDRRALQVAIESALYGRQRGGEGSSVDTTLAFLRRMYGSNPSPMVRTALSTLKSVDDPIKARLIVGQMLRSLGDNAPHVISTAWPGDYPDVQKKFCFHITAFERGERQWPAKVKGIVRSVCEPAIDYKRGDDSAEHNIIRAIWHDICRAWCLVVDVTDLNPNAIIELGMAHALGRRCFIMTQDSDLGKFPQILAKERFCIYNVDNKQDENKLREDLKKFFKAL